MPIKAPVKASSDFAPISAGTHHAVCYGIVDLGTQPSDVYAPKRKLLLIWELPDERSTFERDGKEMDLPRAISRQFTLSMHKKSTLRPFLESWRGKPFTDEEAADFDITRLIGANGILNIVHKAGIGQNAGRTFASVATITPLMKGMNKRAAENPTLIFSLDDFAGRTIAFPENMPEWIQKIVCESEEYLERARSGAAEHISVTSDESFESARPVTRPQPGPDGQAFPSTHQEEDISF